MYHEKSKDNTVFGIFSLNNLALLNIRFPGRNI